MDLTIWLDFALQSALIAVVATLIFGGLAGYALASLGGIPVWLGILVGALVPVAGVVALAIVAMVRHTKKAGPKIPEKWWVRSKAGMAHQIALGVLALLLVVSMFMGWFTIRIAGLSGLSIGAWGTVIGVALLASLVVVLGAGLLGARRPSRIGAVVMGWFGCWWLFLAVAAIALRAPAVTLADSLGALKYTVGDAAKVLHLDNINGTVHVPDGIDPKFLGLGSSTVDVKGLNLADVIPGLDFDIGPGWYLVLAFALGAVVWSFAMVGQASARNRADGVMVPVQAAGNKPGPEEYKSIWDG